MHPNDLIVSSASTRSSEALPDFGFVTQDIEGATYPYSRSGPGMATQGVFQPDRPPPAIPEERPTPLEDRPSDDSSTVHARTAAVPVGPLGTPQFGSSRTRRDRKPSNASGAMGEVGPPRLDFDWERDDPPPPGPPQRNASRQGQVMRYGPPPTPGSEYGVGWEDERRYYPRPPYDYGKPVAPPGSYREDWYGDDPYYNRPYRRPSTIRESAEWGGSYRGGGPPRPPRRPRYRPHWEEPSDDGESDEQPLRKPRRKKTARSNPSSRSPPPEVIMRLPFTEWMNRSAKAREFIGVGLCL